MYLTPCIDRGKEIVQTDAQRPSEEAQLMGAHAHQSGFDLGQTHAADVPAQQLQLFREPFLRPSSASWSRTPKQAATFTEIRNVPFTNHKPPPT
jgi:hypothetical protein